MALIDTQIKPPNRWRAIQAVRWRRAVLAVTPKGNGLALRFRQRQGRPPRYRTAGSGRPESIVSLGHYPP